MVPAEGTMHKGKGVTSAFMLSCKDCMSMGSHIQDGFKMPMPGNRSLAVSNL